ncbi:hypothetical protein B0H14DRAFT_2613783 [Mycena olivaceomarginata]|nr:hypothetical protein B0H14DRAFT_2613783 [Mycena olivaceomarginata]
MDPRMRRGADRHDEHCKVQLLGLIASWAPHAYVRDVSLPANLLLARKWAEEPIHLLRKGKQVICGHQWNSLQNLFQARACKQVKGVSNGRWQSVKSWEAAIKIWNDNCEVYHKAGCPAPVRPAALHSVPPMKKTTTCEVHHKAHTNTAFEVGFQMGKDTSSAAVFEAGFWMGMGMCSAAVLPSLPPSASASRSSHTMPKEFSTNNHQAAQRRATCEIAMHKSIHTVPSSFSILTLPPVRNGPGGGVLTHGAAPQQWAIGGVNKFFAQRYIRLLVSIPACTDLKDPELMRWTISSHFIWGRQISWGPRNVKKLWAFIQHKEYVPGPNNVQYSDEE